MTTPGDAAMLMIAEYDSAAEWCAQRGHSGGLGSPLPSHLSTRVFDEITSDVDAFKARVNDMAYWVARGKP